MAYPQSAKVIDLMLSIPGQDNSAWYDFMKPLLLDEQSRQLFTMPAQYMFRNIPKTIDQDDYIAYTIAEMDKYNIQKAMLDVDENNAVSIEALDRYPDRFFSSLAVDPNRGMDEVRKIVRLHEKFDLKAVTGFPSGTCPQAPINDKKWYPIYAKLVELDLPLPAYEQVLKASHTFNLLDARHAISVTERQRYILRVRDLARQVAESYYARREALGFPALQGAAQ